MFPEFWDELKEKDWKDMLLLRQQLIDKPKEGLSVFDVRCEAVRCLLLNRGIRARMSDDKYFLLVRKAANKLYWLWKEADGKLELTYRTTVNLLPRWDRLIGPVSHGGDLVFGEFKDAITLCKAYDNAMRENPDGNNEMILRQLAGLLYRLRDGKVKKHVRRVAYDADGAEAQLARGNRLPSWFVWGVYAWFSFFCEYLATGIFIIDGEEVCFAKVFGSDKKANASNESNNIGLNSIALTLSESQVFGDFDDVMHTPLMRVMLKLLHDRNQAEHIEKEIKKHKKP